MRYKNFEDVPVWQAGIQQKQKASTFTEKLKRDHEALLERLKAERAGGTPKTL